MQPKTPPLEAVALRDMAAEMRDEARVHCPLPPLARAEGLRTLAGTSSFAPAGIARKADSEAPSSWFQESCGVVEECAHCKAEGTIRVSSQYGVRRDPKRRNSIRQHKGVDIRAPKGSPTLAFKGGTVIRADRFSSYGLTVEIRQYDGMVARYAHLNKIQVRQGEQVESGQVLGEVGRTGRATGNHLHFELIRDGESLDPMQFVEYTEQLVHCLQMETASAGDAQP